MYIDVPICYKERYHTYRIPCPPNLKGKVSIVKNPPCRYWEIGGGMYMLHFSKERYHTYRIPSHEPINIQRALYRYPSTSTVPILENRGLYINLWSTNLFKTCHPISKKTKVKEHGRSNPISTMPILGDRGLQKYPPTSSKDDIPLKGFPAQIQRTEFEKPFHGWCFWFLLGIWKKMECHLLNPSYQLWEMTLVQPVLETNLQFSKDPF